MTCYRRILVPIFDNGNGERLLKMLQDVAGDRHVEAKVVRLIEPHCFAEPDGPAAFFLPEEAAARRVRDVRRQLDLQLSRLNLGWVEAEVVWRQPRERLGAIIRAWQPDLIIAGRRHLPVDVPPAADVLTTSGLGLMQRLAHLFVPPVPRHA